MSSSAQAKKHSQYESSISLPPISEFSSRFRLPASPPMSIPNKRMRRSIDNTAKQVTDTSTSVSLPALGEPSVWDIHRSMPPKLVSQDHNIPQQQQQQQQHTHQGHYRLQHPATNQHDQRHRTLSPSPPPTPPLPLPSSFGYYNKAGGGIDANYESGSNASSSQPPTPATKEGMSSAQVLAEKRKRNAGASARFRERRKLRERDLQETCKLLDRRVFALESALKQLDPNHSLLVSTPPPSTTTTRTNQVSPSSSSAFLSSLSPEPTAPAPHHSPYSHQLHQRHSQDYSTTATHATSPTSSLSPPLPPSSALDHTLSDRVGQLEYMMTLLHQEKITDSKKLASLEKENRHLRTRMIATHTKQQFDLDDEDGGDGNSIASSSSSSGVSTMSRKNSLTHNDASTYGDTHEERSIPSLVQ